MKPLILTALLALAAPQAAAGDLSFGFGFGHHDGNSDVRVRIGYRGAHRPHPRPRVHVRQVWVAGHYDTVNRQVWVPGYTRKVWQPALYGWRTECGMRIRYMIRAAGYTYITVPGHYETTTERVWVPGHYETVRC